MESAGSTRPDFEFGEVSIPRGNLPDTFFGGAASVEIGGHQAARLRDLLGADSGPALERYRTLELLGKGGMGAVHLAFDQVLGREVAIKVVLDLKKPALLARFLQEVKVTAGLSHPGIVRIYNFGVDAEGRPYFTMRRIRGRPWSELMAGQSLHERLEVFERVAEAVAYAHSRGVLHRDLKPANVLAGEYGEVVLADWGLAGLRMADCGSRNCRGEGEGEGERQGPSRAEGEGGVGGLTASGRFLGTPGYAAPEQVDGDLERMGPASDVYALGAILYECLAGRPAFPGSVPQRIAAQTKGPPPFSAGGRAPGARWDRA